ncbi:Uncharacterised protein [Serratia entomophila]|uniref:Afp11 n=1 Tax=Serratia entomophila TaxID=42906 RepID=Q6HAC8_9GAMM|nr:MULTISPECIES: hypothetical protein [Serratia]6RAO_I Chain I, Afp11 [Serratia entomophila]AAT48348.1 Afp11 [Serratia entomophila]UIW20921.1 hypothetical protein KHA73_24165 [Serratia entomophila]ULG10369.1 Afp11 [Serratia entomophila]ULG10648.1 Afp11 [Serratia entomophila]ULG10867.1 Afp11 [Serratia entomophila]
MSDLEQLKQILGNGLTDQTFLLEPRTGKGLLNLMAKYTEAVPFAGHTDADWKDFWMAGCTLEALSDIYQYPGLAEKKLPVQQAFLLALLHLLETPRAMLNTVPARHRSLYYRDLLGFAPRAPQPDSVAVSFTLQRNSSPYALPAGSLLDGGQDSAGNSITYQTDDSLLITGQQLEQLCWTAQVGETWKRYTAIDSATGVTLPAEGLRLFTATGQGTDTKEKAPELYLGFSGTSAQDTLSLYWSVRASSALDVTWWYYQGTKWASLDAELQDNTASLSVSNLWRARLPADSQPGSGLPQDDEPLEAGYYWIKGTLKENKEAKDENSPAEAMPQLQAVLANAMTATLNVAQAIDDSHFSQPLPANTINQLVTPVAAISDVRQPLPSVGGQPRETEMAMLQRAAPRIAHRQRAITWNNMRSLLMEHYPEIFDVRFPDVDKLSRLPALEVQSLMVIPDGRYGDNDDALRPALSNGRLSRMAQWLSQYTSLWAAPTLKNPKYIDVTARYRVTFVVGIRPDYGYRQLAAQLQHDYMPWATDRRQAVTPGNQVDYYQLLATLQQSPLVQSVNALVLSHDVIDETGKPTSMETQSTVTARDDEVLILCPEGETHV